MLTKTMIDIQTKDGTMPAHWMVPDGNGPFPAVVVLMEAFGLVPHIEDVCERLTAEGYVTLAPDVYYRSLPNNKVGYDELPKAIALMQEVTDDGFIDDMKAVLGFMEGSEKIKQDSIGVIGFCMGGRLAFLSACEIPDKIAAAAPFYGGGISGHLQQAEKIQCPTLLFFADQDGFIPLDQVEAVDARLKELGKDYRIKRYADADHGFFCTARSSYHAESAADAWEELKRFLSKNLI